MRVTVWYAGQGVIAVIGGVDVASTSFTWFIPESLRKKAIIIVFIIYSYIASAW